MSSDIKQPILSRFLLFVGTAHDPELRGTVAARVAAAGFHVYDVDGPFGTVVITAADDAYPALQAIEEVTDVVLDEPYDENCVLAMFDEIDTQ